MEGMQVSVQIAFSLPETISVEPEVLGRVDALSISGLTGSVVTPNDCEWGTRKFWQDIDWEDIDLVPDLQEPTGLIAQLSEISIDWGWVTSGPEYGVEINAVLLSLDSVAETPKVDIYGWFRGVTNWLQAYTAQVLTPQPADEELASRMIDSWRIVDGNAEKVKSRNPETRLDIPRWTLVTVPIWSASVQFASAGDELPLNWQLLVDSLRALYAKYPRRAVIEAFTALEVTLRDAIRQRVERCGDSTIASVIINQHRTLGPLIKLASDLGVNLPEDLKPPIVELRNSAIHRGEMPVMQDALKVWQVAYSLAQLQSPLPTL
jgi:hypothetical protein